MSALWSEQQRQWLQAMGHRVLVLAGDEMPDAAAEPAKPAAAMVRPASGARPPPTARAFAAAQPVASPAVQSSPPASPAAADRHLHRALLRATGQRTTRAAQAMLQDLRADPAALRADAAAKRALWVRLRALRKAAQRA